MLQLSLLMAASPVVAMLAQPLWGLAGDRAGSKNNVLRVLVAGSCIAIFLLALGKGYLWVFLCTCLFAAFQTSVTAMADTITLETLTRRREKFGPIRLSGTIAFALCSFFVGQALEGHVERMPYMAAFVLVLAFFSTYALPSVEGHQRRPEKRVSVRVLFRSRGLMVLLLLFLLLQITMSFYYTFFSTHVTEILGVDLKWLGKSMLISAGSEIPFLLFGDRLYRKYGAGRLLSLAAAALSLRWLLLWLVNDPNVVLWTQVLHGGGFIVMTFSMAQYINHTVPAELRASGQLLLGILGFGLARALGALAGYFLEPSAIGSMFAVSMAVTLAVLITLIVLNARGFLRSGEEEEEAV